MDNKLAQSWLTLQCQMIPHVTGGVAMFTINKGEPLRPTACWPNDDLSTEDLLAAANLALSRKAPVVSASQLGDKDKDKDKENIVVACPLLKNNVLQGVVSVQVIAPKGQQAAIIQLLQWGSAWLELTLSRNDEPAGKSPSLVLSTLAGVLKTDRADEAATAAVNELMQHITCERVSIGLLEKDNIRIQALSQSASYEPRSNLVRKIEAAMLEAVMQSVTIVFQPRQPKTSLQKQAHRLLSLAEAKEYICTIQLNCGDLTIGAICFERLSGQPFDQSTVRLCEDVAQLLSPVLQLKLQHDRPLLNKIREDGVTAPVNQLFSMHNLKWKLALPALLVIVVTASFVNGVFRVTAPAYLEGKVQRVVVAPFEGYISQAYARAGETVKSGAVLAELDNKDLKLEQRKLKSQRDEMRKQYNKALAELDHARTRISQTQVAQADAKLALIDEQLGRTKLQAPFDGVIIAGDLSQSLGTPVERGQIMFEMAPLNEYRVVLQVDEQDIVNLKKDQQGFITLASMPDTHIPLIVEKIASFYQSDEEKALFRVEASIPESESIHSLRPGMKGVGKIEIGQRGYLWMWTRKLVAWLQLRLWSWLP